MTKNSNYIFHPKKHERGVPLKMWTNGVPVEPDAIDQLHRTASLPFNFKHVAVMPDVHVGTGSTIGTVIATKGAIVPATVGVDLGCGMMAIKTSLSANELPDNLSRLRPCIEAAVPHGRTGNGDYRTDRGAWGNVPKDVQAKWNTLSARWADIIEKHPKLKNANTMSHLGTLGTGNHFIEVCLDKEDSVWVMLHSGSRGVGAAIGNYFINKAKEEMARYHILPFLEDANLSYLVENTEVFDDYREAVTWAQDFAMLNREVMMAAVLKVMRDQFPPFMLIDEAVNCHHNYVSKENHFGENVWITRKGAVNARKGMKGIIPGSMGARSFIVSGKGNPESFCSCSHGAGRVMSRGRANKEISLEDHAKATAGIECRKDADVIDESPAAYKNIDAVMAAQSDLVEIEAELRQVLCVKG